MILLFLATESTSAHIEFFHNLRYQGTGMLIVLLSLGILAVVVSAVARILEQRESPVPETAAARAAGEDPTLPPEIQTVIAVAVYMALPSGHRIHQVRPVANPNLSAWSAEGRRQIFQSHTIRR